MEGEPVKQDEMMLRDRRRPKRSRHSPKACAAFARREKEFDVSYPEDWGQSKLAGRTVRFHSQVKGIRRKELPELNDEFAKDLGDYRAWKS